MVETVESPGGCHLCFFTAKLPPLVHGIFQNKDLQAKAEPQLLCMWRKTIRVLFEIITRYSLFVYRGTTLSLCPGIEKHVFQRCIKKCSQREVFLCLGRSRISADLSQKDGKQFLMANNIVLR